MVVRARQDRDLGHLVVDLLEVGARDVVGRCRDELEELAERLSRPGGAYKRGQGRGLWVVRAVEGTHVSFIRCLYSATLGEGQRMGASAKARPGVWASVPRRTSSRGSCA